MCTVKEVLAQFKTHINDRHNLGKNSTKNMLAQVFINQQLV